MMVGGDFSSGLAGTKSEGDPPSAVGANFEGQRRRASFQLTHGGHSPVAFKSYHFPLRHRLSVPVPGFFLSFIPFFSSLSPFLSSRITDLSSLSPCVR